MGATDHSPGTDHGQAVIYESEAELRRVFDTPCPKCGGPLRVDPIELTFTHGGKAWIPGMITCERCDE